MKSCAGTSLFGQVAKWQSGKVAKCLKYFVGMLPLALGWVAGVGVGETPPAARQAAPAPAPGQAKVEAKGLNNVFKISDRLYSGSSPEGDEGFRSLKDLGIRTVVSVDGMAPDVDRAHQYGMRYVHLPVGYDGIAREQTLRLARAVRDLPGPVYLHCHHGQHRGPAAAAVVSLCLDEKCTVAAAVAQLRRAGTDPHYTGLYAAPRDLRRPTTRELDAVSADFPETAKVPALAQAMVGIDERWDNLKRARAAGWKTPKDHPDIDPAHEALLLREGFREAGRLKDVSGRPAEFQRRLHEAEREAEALEAALRSGKDKPATDARAVDQGFRRAGAACAECHGRYRDVSPRR